MVDYFGVAANAPAQSCVAMATGVAVNQQPRAVLISCTVAGTITLQFADGTNYAPSFPVGVVQLNHAITKFTNGTATATVTALY